MRNYHHHFDQVEDYLHHRPPYLMIERIVSISDTEVVASKVFSGDEHFLSGHFPGASILPGAMMQEMTTQSAGVLIAARYNPMEKFDTHDPNFNEFALGVLVRLGQAKFKGFARPGDEVTARVKLNAHVSNLFDFTGSILVEDKTIMRNSFRLSNIRSQQLTGEVASP